MENDYLVAETLIEGMAEVNQQDLAGFTPLMWAAGRGGTSTVKMLLDYEADMNIKAIRGQTATSFALTSNYNAVVDILERHKALLYAEQATRVGEGGGAAVHGEGIPEAQAGAAGALRGGADLPGGQARPELERLRGDLNKRCPRLAARTRSARGVSRPVRLTR